MRALLGSFLAAGLLLASTPSRVQDPDPSRWSIEREERELKVAAGLGVDVENLFGELHVRVGDAGRVQLWSVGQRHADDPRPWVLENGMSERAVTVRVAAPPETTSNPADWAKRRVDLTLFVPPEASLRLATAHGLIEVKGVSAPLAVTSLSGEQRLWLHGPLDARSERGAIRAVFLSRAWSAPSHLETVTGNISIELLPHSAARVVLETQGNLTSDFSMTVERLSQLRKRAQLAIDSAGAEILLTSQRGDLSVRELLEPPTSAP